MRGSDNIATMADAIARFEAQVQRLALDIVQAVIRQELERVTAPLDRSVRLEPARPAKRGRPPKQPAARPAKRKSRAQRTSVPQLELKLARAAERQLDLGLAKSAQAQSAQATRPLDAAPASPPAAPEPRAEQPPASGAGASPAPAAPPAAPVLVQPAGSRKRTQWTRETIVHELASWMSKGTAIDAQFMTRHGPRGLVAATRRIFGRFDAALNLAALHVSKMNPEGPASSELA